MSGVSSSSSSESVWTRKKWSEEETEKGRKTLPIDTWRTNGYFPHTGRHICSYFLLRMSSCLCLSSFSLSSPSNYKMWLESCRCCCYCCCCSCDGSGSIGVCNYKGKMLLLLLIIIFTLQHNTTWGGKQLSAYEHIVMVRLVLTACLTGWCFNSQVESASQSDERWKDNRWW